MRSERPLHLDVGVPSGNASGTQDDPGGHADGRSPQQLAEQALALRERLTQPRAAATADQETIVASPFDLFRSSPAAPGLRPPAVAQAQPWPALEQTLKQMASRLLVGDGSQGRRGVQLQLADDAQLPGVVVDIFEEAGRLLTRFTCSQENARERLSASAAWFADSLAQRLQQDTRVQVQTDDPEDPCLVQVDANR